MKNIETARLWIRDFTPEDAKDLHEILGDEETMRNCEPPYDFEKTKAFLEAFCIERQGAVAAVEKQSQKLIGYILFNEIEPGAYEIGWFFNRSYWRQGYAYEACKALIDYAFRARIAHKIFAETVDGVKSTGLMQKLGMTCEVVQQTNGAELYCYSLESAQTHQGLRCAWEHNGSDTLLYAVDFPGAYTRGESLEIAKAKMPVEIRSYAAWLSLDVGAADNIEIIQDSPCDLEVRDADSDVLFEAEMLPLSMAEYQKLKAVALKSAADFLALYEAIPDKHKGVAAPRKTFYGPAPCTAEEMYRHTKSVNAYYFSEIGVEADNEGTILECRQRGFEALEKQPDFLSNPVIQGSYGESWTLRKVLRRFIWHDRIHAKAMYRMAVRFFDRGSVPNPYCFEKEA